MDAVSRSTSPIKEAAAEVADIRAAEVVVTVAEGDTVVVDSREAEEGTAARVVVVAASKVVEAAAGASLKAAADSTKAATVAKVEDISSMAVDKDKAIKLLFRLFYGVNELRPENCLRLFFAPSS